MNEILLYGRIGQDFWGDEGSVTAKSVIDQLAGIDGDVTVRISSGGGDVYEGIDIMTALKNHPGKVTAIVEAVAASAASFIAVGGADEVLMRKTSEMMIHRASSWAEGNSEDMRKSLDYLALQDTKLANIYAAKAGGQVDEWIEVMDSETWYSAEEAVAAGLADGLIDAPAEAPVEASKKSFAMASMQKFKYAGRGSAPPPVMPGRRSVARKSEPSVGQEGKAMSFLKNLAQELGMEEANLRSKLVGVTNETVVVSGEVDVTYPAETLIVPTEKVVIEPIIGKDEGSAEQVEEGTTVVQNSVVDAAGLGLTFEVGTVPEGWVITVDESTGTATATAPSGVEVGAIVEASIKVNGSTDVALTFKVRSLSEEPAETGTELGDGGTAPQTAFASMVPEGMSVVPTAHLDRLNAMARNFGEQQAELDRKNAEERVDRDIREGRFHAQNRTQALVMFEQDPQSYQKVWGSLAKNTFPVAELGHSNTAGVHDPADDDFNPGQLAAERRKAKNGVKK